MTPILSGQLPYPTQAFKTDTGYLVRSKLPYEALTSRQEATFWVLLVLSAISFAVFFYLASQEMEEYLDPSGYIFLAFGLITTCYYQYSKRRLLTVDFVFNRSSNTVTVKFNSAHYRTYLIDESSVFVLEGHTLKYRYGLAQSISGLEISYTADFVEPHKHANVGGFVAALNYVLKIFEEQNSSPLKGSDIPSSMNPMD